MNKAAVKLGSLGGKATYKKHGSDHMRKIGKRGRKKQLAAKPPKQLPSPKSSV